MKIGVFDSGVGGLGVLYESFLCLRDASFIYYADRDNVPYGVRADDEIRELLSQALNFLIAQGCQAIIIACNTASSVANNEFRAKFKAKIIAMEPAIKLALDTHKNAHIIIAATPLTIKGQKLKTLLASLDSKGVDLLALPKLVEFAERGEFEPDYLKSLDLSKCDIFVLGCTHFNYFKKAIKNLNPNISFIDGNFGTVKNLAKTLNLELTKRENCDISEILERTEFFISKRKANESEMALIKKCLNWLKTAHEIN